MAEELTFHLEDFDGPLELLLALVTKHKMDLHNIPILQLIDQYTRTVEQADPDPETASAFIEMAAHLVEMKSFLLLPRSEEGERMKQELTGQLIEYDQCRRMAALLRQKAEAAPVFVRPPMEMEFDNTYDLHHHHHSEPCRYQRQHEICHALRTASTYYTHERSRGKENEQHCYDIFVSQSLCHYL